VCVCVCVCVCVWGAVQGKTVLLCTVHHTHTRPTWFYKDVF